MLSILKVLQISYTFSLSASKFKYHLVGNLPLEKKIKSQQLWQFSSYEGSLMHFFNGKSNQDTRQDIFVSHGHQVYTTECFLVKDEGVLYIFYNLCQCWYGANSTSGWATACETVLVADSRRPRVIEYLPSQLRRWKGGSWPHNCPLAKDTYRWERRWVGIFLKGDNR